jgi:hypothetical protein
VRLDSLRKNAATFFNRKLGLDNLNGPYFLYRCADKQPPTSELHGLAMQDMCLTTPKKNLELRTRKSRQGDGSNPLTLTKLTGNWLFPVPEANNVVKFIFVEKPEECWSFTLRRRYTYCNCSELYFSVFGASVHITANVSRLI